VIAIAALDDALDHIVDDGVRRHVAIPPVDLAAHERHPAGHGAEVLRGQQAGK
jgi:hypothetical protein